MKSIVPIALAAALAAPVASAQSEDYTNFIRQTVLETTPPVYWDMTVPSSGERLSLVPIDLKGARYELWTVKSGSKPTSYLLDNTYVSSFAPVAEIEIVTEDVEGSIPRTRADRPFTVNVTVKGLLDGPLAPSESKSVKLLRHVQSYGSTDGTNIDRTQATLHSQSVIDRNGTVTLDYPMTSVPGANRLQIRGEERFSVFTRKSDGSTDQQIVSRYLQVWPVATGSIAGIPESGKIRFDYPQLTFTLNDLYPKSYTYAQAYKGAPALGTQGVLIPAAQLAIDQKAPESRVWVVDDFSTQVNEDGKWTIEIITETVFGTERLAYTTFEVDRGIEVNSMISTFKDQ